MYFGANSDCFHRPRQVVDESLFDELDGFIVIPG